MSSAYIPYMRPTCKLSSIVQGDYHAHLLYVDQLSIAETVHRFSEPIADLVEHERTLYDVERLFLFSEDSSSSKC